MGPYLSFMNSFEKNYRGFSLLGDLDYDLAGKIILKQLQMALVDRLGFVSKVESRD